MRKDEPGKPGNVEVVDWDVDHADLTWIKPENDGGSPIVGYIIEYKVKNVANCFNCFFLKIHLLPLQEKFGNDWVTALELNETAEKATVTGLKEGTQYEFRVKAVNKSGPGEPSDATKPIIAKSRFGMCFLNCYQHHQTNDSFIE